MPRDLHFPSFDMCSYLEAIQGSLGSTKYRTLVLSVGRAAPRDILEGGLLSCAYYVSSILANAGLIRAKHATVAGLVRDELIPELGWEPTHDPQRGDVAVWNPAIQADGKMHRHIGFYMGPRTAISHSDRSRTPDEHPLFFGEPPRQIEAIYTHSAFHAE
jgi:hypothetical protein